MNKKNIIIACTALIMGSQANAQTVQEDSVATRYSELEQRVNALEEDARQQKVWKRQKYFNIAYVSQSLKDDQSGEKLKSDFGVSLVRGKTYYLHAKPLWGMVKIGLDWTQVDLNYVKYKDIVIDTYDGEDKLKTHQFEYSMHIGPSITVNPVDLLLVNIYGRYAPTFSALYSKNSGEHEFGPSFVSYFIIGGAVSYKTISLGLETRFGKGKFKMFSADEEGVRAGGSSLSDAISATSQKKTIHSTRFYVSLRF